MMNFYARGEATISTKKQFFRSFKILDFVSAYWLSGIRVQINWPQFGSGFETQGYEVIFCFQGRPVNFDHHDYRYLDMYHNLPDFLRYYVLSRIGVWHQYS